MEKQSKEAMLTSAFVAIVQNMNFNDSQINKMLGVDESYMNQLRSQEKLLEIKNSQGKAVAQFIRIMNSLFSLVGYKEAEAINWLNKENKAFDNRKPVDILQEEDGLSKVATYLKESSH